MADDLATRAAAAVEAAFDDAIKQRFGVLSISLIGPDKMEAAAAFARGLPTLAEARTQALAIVATAFGAKE
jgi:hypothetical protein